MNIFKKALIVALSVGLISVPTVTKEVEAANMSGGELLYRKPNSNWNEAGARFATYFFNSSANTWVDMTDSNDDGVYEVTVPSGSWSNLIFCRMNPSTTANNWDNKWGQTSDLTYDGTNNLYTITAGSWDAGSWSVYSSDVEVTPEPEPEKNNRVYVSGSGFSNSYFYAWGNYSTALWPGDKMTKLEADSSKFYYDYYLETPKSFSCIFNNNNDAKTADLTKPIDKNCFNYSDKTWGIYNEYSITYNYNIASLPTPKTVSNAVAHLFSTTVKFESPTVSGYDFLGWSTTLNGEVEYKETYTFDDVTSNLVLYGVWQVQAATDCTVKYIVNGNEYNVTAEIGSTIESNIPTKSIGNDNLVAVEWDKSGEITGDMTVTASSYYTTFEAVQGQLAFDYKYRQTLVVAQLPTPYGQDPVCIAKDAEGNSESINMSWNKDCDDGKKEWFAMVPTKYIKLSFSWGSITTAEYTRDFEKNAIWWDSAEEGKSGYFIYNDVINSTVVEKEITDILNVKMRLGSPIMKSTDFKGVTEYGIRIDSGDTLTENCKYIRWTASNIAKVNLAGEADENCEYIRWNVLFNSIPKEEWSTCFAVDAYVIIDGKEYDICSMDDRVVSVESLSENYVSTLGETTEKYACQFIVDACKA